MTLLIFSFVKQAKSATEKVDSDDPPPDGRIKFKKPTKRCASYSHT